MSLRDAAMAGDGRKRRGRGKGKIGWGRGDLKAMGKAARKQLDSLDGEF